MTIREAKISGIKQIKSATGNEAALDAEILLAHCLGISREELLAHDERSVPAFTTRRYHRLLARRAKHEPIAYLTGHREFFGLQFSVNKHTLIPRPETEMIVEEALHVLRAKSHALFIDVGTGSGAIAIAVAANSNAAIIATDISKPALKIAQRNAAENNVADRIDFRHANLIAGVKMTRPLHFDTDIIIAANPPYIPTKDWRRCMPDVKNFEPRTALDGGPDGLRLYDKLFHQIFSLWWQTPQFESDRREHVPAGRLNFSQAAGDERGGRSLTLICEIDPSQKKSFPKLANKHFPAARVEIKNDLAGLPRIGIIEFFPKR